MMKPNEIQVYVKTVTKNKRALLLLYKDARYDMAALDEKYGILGWKKSYKQIGDMLFCMVSVWDNEKNCWIDREDVGSDTQVGEEKGHASDAFKRACYNFGIGRELYTAPDIWVELADNEVNSYDNKGKTIYTCRQKFYVSHIGYNKGTISKLIVCDSRDVQRFVWNASILPPVMAEPEPSLDELREVAKAKVMATDKFDQAWKDKVVKGIERYDEVTLNRLITETLKGE